MPKDLIGSWCRESPGPYRVPDTYIQCKKGDEDLIIRRKSYTSFVGTICKPLRVTEQDNRTWMIEERCHETTWSRWERRANFLYITPMPPE